MFIFLKQQIIWPLETVFQQTFLAPYFYVALGLTLLLEFLIPANPKQRPFSLNFFQDMVWFFYEALSDIIITVVYLQGLRWVYKHYFSFLTIHAAEQWPYALRFVLGILLLDFLYWLQHYINHKVPWFWQLHTIHHSQKEINFFTDFRYHILEYFIRKTFLVLPFLIFAINTPTVVVFSIVTTWYTRFYHGNIRTNLGWLRHVLVTPQSHRLHHSMLPEHRDCNFGSLFCIWDKIFKTQHPSFNEYPPTGIDDENFPQPERADFGILVLPLKQLFYPVFRIIQRRKEV